MQYQPDPRMLQGHGLASAGSPLTMRSCIGARDQRVSRASTAAASGAARSAWHSFRVRQPRRDVLQQPACSSLACCGTMRAEDQVHRLAVGGFVIHRVFWPQERGDGGADAGDAAVRDGDAAAGATQPSFSRAHRLAWMSAAATLGAPSASRRAHSSSARLRLLSGVHRPMLCTPRISASAAGRRREWSWGQTKEPGCSPGPEPSAASRRDRRSAINAAVACPLPWHGDRALCP